MTRILIGLAIGLVFVAGFVLDPAGVAQLAYVCATGGCGILPLWLAMALGAGLAACAAVTLTRRMIVRRSSRRKPRASGRRKPGSPAKAKPTGKARKTPRRKTPAGA